MLVRLNFEACTVVYWVLWMLVFARAVLCQTVMLAGLFLTTFLILNCYQNRTVT